MILPLISALDLPDKGIISLIGGGGKTSLLYALGKELSYTGKKIVVTTSTHIFAPNKSLAELLIIDPQPKDLEKALQSTCLVCVGGKSESLKLTAPGSNFFDWCLHYADYAIVEADGARNHPFKAPKDGEPALPFGTNIVIGVAGIHALGQTIEQACHRPEHVCKILGVSASKKEILTPKQMAQVICSKSGYLKGVDANKNFRLVINQCDTAKEIAMAEEVACHLKNQGFRIIITALQHTNPVKCLLI